MIGHLGVSTPRPFLCTTTPQPQCIDINISSSGYTDIAGDKTQVANQRALTYALTLSATGSFMSESENSYSSKFCWVFLYWVFFVDNLALGDNILCRRVWLFFVVGYQTVEWFWKNKNCVGNTLFTFNIVFNQIIFLKDLGKLATYFCTINIKYFYA